MQLQLFKTLWGHTGDFASAISQAQSGGFHGIEGPAPGNISECSEWQQRLADTELLYIAEITTAGSYVPHRQSTLLDHLNSFQHKLEQSLILKPQFVTCLGGCDAWPEERNLEFFSRAMQMAKHAGVTVSFETHRGRALFNPWVTDRLVQQLPGIKLTCDFSHWCVVCERLMDSELDVLTRLAPHAWHIHARVGYEQGPQVPDPSAPEYGYALRAHQRWWEMIWQQQLNSGKSITSMTPEFGPDGYLHEAPFTREPVSDLWQLNQWMANEEKQHFQLFMTG